jgi:uncharacterized protein (DUF1015 family)
MPQILPFRGLRYTAAAGSLAAVLAPPYDVISPTQRAALAARSPYNAVHLELAEGGEEKYARVAGLLHAWQQEGQLARDEHPMLYVYEQCFTFGGVDYRRRGLLASVEAQPWDEGAVLPHEYTMSGPKEDRLKLLEATGVQLSPVFMIARDRAGQLQQFLGETVATRAPDIEATTPEGDTHRLWLVEASRLEMRRLAPLLSERFMIADGHHRYETAVNYKQILLDRLGTLPRDHPARFAMSVIVPLDDPGLVIRPIHRVVPKPAPPDWRARLAATYTVEELGPIGDGSALEARLAATPGGVVALGLDRGQATLLTPRGGDAFAAVVPPGHSAAWTQVPPNALRYAVLGPLWGVTDDDLRLGLVDYEHEVEPVLAAAARGACGFLLHPCAVSDVVTLAEQGERMPQKSTFFHPKLATGLAFYPLTGE